MSAADTEFRNWTVDKRIPIALVLTIAIQTAGAVWWVSSINSRVVSLEDGFNSIASHDARIVRLETTGEHIQRSLQSISEKLDRIIERK